MVAIFTGAGTGFERGSGSVLGAAGLLGSSTLGRGGEQLFLNAATGNLLISQSDEFLVGLGPDVSISRTYNSLGDLSDENADNWRQSTQRRIVNLTGTLNTVGSTVQRVGADGATITYTWDATKSAYVGTDGAGAYDTLTSSGGVWTWRDGDSQITETYALEYGSSTAWRIISQADTDGNTLSFTYVANSNHLDKVTTQDGSYVQYSWSGNNITQILTGYTDLATSTAKTLTRTRYAYDGSNRLSSVTVDLSPGDNSVADGAVYTTTYTYSGTSTRVASISQSDGSRVDITYDGSNRVATMAQTTAAGVTRTTTLTYGSGYTTITDQAGQIVRMDYDTANNLTKITMPPAVTGASPQITQFAYDTSGNVTSVTDALTNATTYTNFVNGNWQTATDRLGNVTTRTYGSKNEILTETTTSSDAASAAASHTTRYAYDIENHLRYRISAEGYVTSYSYHPEGQVWGTAEYGENLYDVSGLSATTALTEAQMDSWYWGITDLSGMKYTESGYDARGNLNQFSRYSFTAASGIDFGEGAPRTVTTYDQAGNLLSRFQDGRATETFVYDGLGRLKSAIDVNGGTTSYAFDDANSKTIVTFASGLVQTSTYNKAGELISFMEAGATTSLAAVTGTATYGYDQLGQLRWNLDATGKKTYHLYDNVGRKVADISSAGEVAEYKYDADNRLIATVRYANTNSGTLINLDTLTGAADIATYRPTSSASDLWTWNVYDKEGRLIQSIAGDGSTVVNGYDSGGGVFVSGYDGAGRLVRTTNYFNKLAAGTLTGFKTTLPTTVTFPTADSAHDAVTRNFYDKDGRVVGTLDGEGFVTKAIYDKAGFKVDEIAYMNVSLAADRASGTFSTILSHISADALNDRHTRYVYNGLGQLRFVIDSNYQVTEMRYAVGDGQPTTTIRYANAIASSTTDFGWDNLKALVAAGGFASPTTDRTSWAVYDWSGRLAYAIDGEGGVTKFSYNAAGQLTKSTQYAAVRSTTSLPDQATMDSWATANANSANDRVTRNYYDGAGVLRYVVDGEGFVTRRTEDAEGRLALIERFANAATTTDATTIDTLHAWVIASGGVSANTTTAYDVDGRVSTVTDGEGNVTRSTYNINGTLQSQTVADGTSDASTTYYVYDGAGVTEQHRAYGTSAVSITRYSYDGLGNVLTITDPDNHVTSQTFDRLGQQLTSTNALSGVTSFVYNAFGEVVQTTDPLGNVSFNYYNALGQLTKSCDALKYVTETSYNVFGEVASVTRRYNAASNTPSITVQPTVTPDAVHDATTSFTYDRLGRLKQTTDAQGYYEQYTLNAFGNRTTVLNKLGGSIINTYDRRGLLVSEVLPMASVNNAGTQVAATVTNKFAYDARGNRTQMIEAFGLAEVRTTNYVYDKIDRLITKTSDAVTTVAYSDFTSTTAVTVTTTGSVVPTESYVYDKRGNLIQVTDANGAKTLSYYDKIGRKTGEVGPLGTLKAWTYDAAGNMLTERVYGDVVAVPGTPGGTPPSPINSAYYRETVFAYDVLNRLSTTTIGLPVYGTWNGGSGVTTTISGTATSTLTYDADGNVVKAVDANGNETYSYYDSLGRKTVQVDALNYVSKWTYDAEGNVLSETRFATALAAAPTVGVVPAMPGSVADDRITNFTYDKNGHRLTETRTGVVAWTVSSSNGALTAASTNSVVTYTYNGLGQVLTKAEATGDAVTYVYDATGRLTKETRATYADQTGANVTPEVLYSYNGLNNLSRTQQGEKTAIEANAAVGRITTYLYGSGGRLLTMTDPAGGAHTYAYDAAGNLVQDSYTRTKSDATTANEAILYRRDLLGRVITQTIATNNAGTWTRGDSQNSQFNAWGDIAQRGVNGLWQEQFSYNSRGLVEKTNTGDGVWRFYVYDKVGNQVLAIESEGNDYSATLLGDTATAGTLLNSLGGVAGGTFIDGVNCSINVYDKRNQATQSILPQRETTAIGSALNTVSSSQTYNAFGEVATQTDALSNSTILTYNTMGRVIQKALPAITYTKADNTTASAAPTEVYYYDLSGRAVAKKDANGNTISQTLLAGTGYSGGDALTQKEFHPDAGVAQTKYDVFGDARTLINELNQSETRTYDNMGRLITQLHRGGLLTDNYTYDILGQRLTHWNSFLGSGNKETTDYDLQGRVTKVVAFGGDAINTTYTWDATIANSGMSAVAYGGWTQVDTYANSKTMTTKSDAFGHDISKVDLGAHSFTYAYDKAGRQITRTLTGETLTTTWFNTGLTQKLSFGASDYANYTYDKNGQRLTEYTVRGGVVAQNATAVYNAVGWMTSWSEAGGTISPISSKTLEYDLNGNVRRDRALINNIDAQGVAIGQTTGDQYFSYDTVNRITLTGGTTFTYDAAGQRVRMDWTEGHVLQVDNPAWNEVNPNTRYKYVSWTAQVREDFTYNANGTMSQIQHAESTADDNGSGGVTVTNPTGPGAIISTYAYDAMQRTTSQKDYPSSVVYEHDYTYNAKGQVTNETVINKHGSDTYIDYTTNTFGTGTGYALGQIVTIADDSYKNGSDSSVPDTSTTNSYAWYDGAVQSSTVFDPDSSGGSTTYTSTYTLSPSGTLNSVYIADGRPRTVTFKNDMNGQVIRRDESDNNATMGDPHGVWYRFNGREISTSINRADPARLNDQASITSRTAALPTSYSFTPDGAPVGDLALEMVNSYHQGSTARSYTVEGGETLQGIAQAVWGDSSLWYKIAEANGLGADTPLIQGQTLNLPAGVVRSKNNASTFKPYDAAQAMGDTAPTSPKPPKKNKCGVFGQILLVAIAVAVSIALPGGGTVLGAAFNAMIGSAVSQGVGLATGIQDKFSFKSLALAGLSAGIAVGVGDVLGKGAMLGSKLVGDAVRGVVGSAVTQGIAVATGLQKKFDWAGVAAAGVSAGIGGALGRSDFMKGVSSQFGRTGATLVGGVARDIANAATRSLIEGSSFGDNMLAGLPDVIAQTLVAATQDGIAAYKAHEEAQKQQAAGAGAIVINEKASLAGVTKMLNAAMTSMDAPGATKAGATSEPAPVAGGGQVGEQQTDTGSGQEIVITGSRHRDWSQAQWAQYEAAQNARWAAEEAPVGNDYINPQTRRFGSMEELYSKRDEFVAYNAEYLGRTGKNYADYSEGMLSYAAEEKRLLDATALADSNTNQLMFAGLGAPLAIGAAGAAIPVLLAGGAGYAGIVGSGISLDYGQANLRGLVTGRFEMQGTVGGSTISYLSGGRYGEGAYALGSFGFGVGSGLFTNSEGFLFGSINAKAPFDINVQRFGSIQGENIQAWGLQVGSSNFVNRRLVAILPDWNPLTELTSGVIPRGTELRFGIIGPQGFRYPGGLPQFDVRSGSVVQQRTITIPR